MSKILNFLSLPVQVFSKSCSEMIGYVYAVRPKSKEVLIGVPHSIRKIWTVYEEQFTLTLLNNVNVLCELSGKIYIDKDEVPLSIKFIESCRPVDASDIDLAEVVPVNLEVSKGSKFKVSVTLDESGQFYHGRNEELNIGVTGSSRYELKEYCRQWIEILWEAFVDEDETNFSNGAKTLRNTLKHTFFRRIGR